jgi:hypothetical protein
MKKSTVTAIAVAIGLALQLAKPDKRGKKQHMRLSSAKHVSNEHSPLSNMLTLGKRARQHIVGGGVTADHATDRKTELKLLNEAFTTEIV